MPRSRDMCYLGSNVLDNGIINGVRTRFACPMQGSPYLDQKQNQARDMTDQQLLDRIASDPKVMVGKPVIKGTRLTVEFILNRLAHGSTVDEILGEYEGLSREDVQACLLFASQSLSSMAYLPLKEESA